MELCARREENEHDLTSMVAVLNGCWTRYGGSGLFAERPTLEDPFLFATPRGAHVLMHYWRADNCTTPGCAFVGNHAFASVVGREIQPRWGGLLVSLASPHAPHVSPE